MFTKLPVGGGWAAPLPNARRPPMHSLETGRLTGKGLLGLWGALLTFPWVK